MATGPSERNGKKLEKYQDHRLPSPDDLQNPPLLTALNELLAETAAAHRTSKTALLAEAQEIDTSHWYKVLRGDARLSAAKYQSLLRLLCLPPSDRTRLNDLFEAYRADSPVDGRTLRKESWISSSRKAQQIVQGNCALKGIPFSEIHSPDAFDCYLGEFISGPYITGVPDEGIRNGSALYEYLRMSTDKIGNIELAILLSHIFNPALLPGRRNVCLTILSHLRSMAQESKNGFVNAVYLHNRRKFAEAFSGTGGIDSGHHYCRLAMESLQELLPSDNVTGSSRYNGLISAILLRARSIEGKQNDDLERLLNANLNRMNYESSDFRWGNHISMALYHLGNEDFEVVEQHTSKVILGLDRTFQHYDWMRLQTRLIQSRSELARMRSGNAAPDSKEAAISYLSDAKRISVQFGNAFLAQSINDQIASAKSMTD